MNYCINLPYTPCKEDLRSGKRVTAKEKVALEEALGRAHPATPGLTGKHHSATGRRFLAALMMGKDETSFELPAWEDRCVYGGWTGGPPTTNLPSPPPCPSFLADRSTEKDERDKRKDIGMDLVGPHAALRNHRLGWSRASITR